MESSEDITRILDEFLSIREKVIGMQYEALVKYDAAIDSIDRIDSISSRVNRLEVDHNLLRHLGAISQKERSEMTSELGEYSAEFEDIEEDYTSDVFETDAPSKFEILPHELSSAINAADAITKIGTPSFAEKSKIRSTLLKFIENTKEKEIEIVRTLFFLNVNHFMLFRRIL